MGTQGIDMSIAASMHASEEGQQRLSGGLTGRAPENPAIKKKKSLPRSLPLGLESLDRLKIPHLKHLGPEDFQIVDFLVFIYICICIMRYHGQGTQVCFI
jgi:hypothetical protein